MSTAQTNFQGYTAEQVKVLLQGVAYQAHCLRNVLTGIAVGQRPSQDIFVAASMVESLGMLTDRLSGEGVVGSVEAWLFGPAKCEPPSTPQTPTAVADKYKGAAEAEVLRHLWQVAMDAACNTNVTDATEGVDEVIYTLRAMHPFLPAVTD